MISDRTDLYIKQYYSLLLHLDCSRKNPRSIAYQTAEKTLITPAYRKQKLVVPKLQTQEITLHNGRKIKITH